jgi:hypothetical protein
VALGKMLNLGGIDNRPPKANQTMGRFRVARNVMPTPDGRIIPRYDWANPNPLSLPTNVKAYHHISQYDNSILAMTSHDSYALGHGFEVYRMFKDNVIVPGIIAGSPMQSRTHDVNSSVMSYRKNNTVYQLLPSNTATLSYLAKYDGVQMWSAGVPQPKISVAAGVLTGTTWLRVVQHVIDFDNNEPMSEYVEFTAAAAASVNINFAGNFATNMIPSRAEDPKGVITSTGMAYKYFRGTSSYNAGTLDYTIATSDTNITDATDVGTYVMVSWYQFSLVMAAAGLSGFGLAMRVKSVSAGFVTLDATNTKYLDTNREWKSGGTLAGLGANLTEGTQSFGSVWRSSSKTGIYYYTAFAPTFPDSSVSYIVAADTNPLTSAEAGYDQMIVTLGPALNDMYDVQSRKLSPNSLYPFGLNTSYTCMTNFQDMMLLASDDLIWISDPTLGGSYEQLNTGYFIRVGDTEYGRITSICGTQDFLVVCRERKNYYVTGNITTGNYRVQEIIEAEIGAWSNNASICVKDSVIFLTAIGVYQVMSGGKASKLSETCPKNFATYDALAINEDVSFRMTGFVSDITNTVQDGLSVAYDEFRELLVFMKKGVVNSPCLVLHTKTGEFYEWDGFAPNMAPIYANCVAFINAEYYWGEIYSNPAAAFAAWYAVEDNSSQGLSYPATNPIKLYTTWLTAGEPSLEKELLQIKMFGRFSNYLFPTVAPVKVCHYKDWDISTKITDVEYFPNNTALALTNQIQYSHKKRLNSDKVLAASVGIEVTTAGPMFEIESFEVEFNPIQTGMKK